LKNNIKVDIR